MSNFKETAIFKALKTSKLHSVYILIRDFFSIPVFFIKRQFVVNKKKSPNVLTIKETIKLISKEKLSVSRFGDGEFRWMSNIPNENSFQHSSGLLSQRLNEVIMHSKNPSLLVCIPDVFRSLKVYTYNDTAAWSHLLIHYYNRWINLINEGKTFGDSNFTRPYIDRKDKSESEAYFDAIKNLWQKRNIVIIEGKYTRFGVGNDLLDSVKSVKRIECPAVNAFDQYKEIYNNCTRLSSKDDLFLIALGPTATVLAHDLCNTGIQSIDIGHVDIEYDWFKMQVKKRVPIVGKYVNEVTNGKKIISKNNDSKYLSEIICKISS
ncbi:hypothetical protein BSQ39_05305 [Loigolactobacillus backii]|uniref:SP_1767 family glycosyltransferase n=1 Tax=Loigolactobacillus backii TaxID=375175 RepID=UPI000C1CAEBB|nr:SP_1767 family glycosyltransferase [Loigolactobacillus backii]PIO83030.1 hypothetical protein BSQ39_05305 [Loigolactobacillus backii]